MSEKILVAVYGSLKRGFGNHRLLATSDYLETFKTEPQFTMLNLGAFPGLVMEGSTPIEAELFEVTQDVFRNLDGLEGYPSFYTRIQIPSPRGLAWIYVLNEKKGQNPMYREREVVESGVWERVAYR